MFGLYDVLGCISVRVLVRFGSDIKFDVAQESIQAIAVNR